MKVLKTISFAFLMLLLAGNISAQSKTVSGILKFSPSGLRPIYQGGEVKGYIALYMFDKEDKQNSTLILQIFDENLNEVGQKKISVPKTEAFLASGYDGSNILVKFGDYSKKIYDIRVFNENGDLKEQLTIPVSKSGLYALTAADQFPDLFSVENLGFVNYSTEDFKKTGFTIDFINDEGIKWTYSSNKTSDKYESASYYQSSSDILLTLVYKRSKLLSQDADAYILALDIKTGKKLFEIPTVTSKYEVSPLGAYVEDANKIVVFGQYFNKGANILKDKSLGFASVELDGQGNITKDVYLTWAESVGKFEEVKGNKLKDGGYIYFHKAVKAANGNFVLVGEQFHKTANAMGIAGSVLGGGFSNMTKLVISDFMFLEFNKDFQLVNAKRIEKQESSFSYPGLDYLGPMMTSWVAKMLGAFDYEYTSIASDNSKFSVVYIDIDKLEDSKKKEAYCGSVTYQDGKYMVDKVPFTRDEKASVTRIRSAKNGYFLLMRYYKKTKELKLDLVKFNS